MKASTSLVTEDLSPSSGRVVFPDGSSTPITVSIDALPYGGMSSNVFREIKIDVIK